VKNEVVIKFRDLFSEESKGLMLQFSLDDYVDKELKFVSRITYTDVVDNQQKTISNENVILPVKNVDAYLTHFNKTVTEQVVLFVANENMERAMAEVDKGNYENARRFSFASKRMISAIGDSTKRGEELNRMYQLSDDYEYSIQNASSLSKDSIGRLQKSKKAYNYQIRNKKQ
jgi:hypothetical protein